MLGRSGPLAALLGFAGGAVAMVLLLLRLTARRRESRPVVTAPRAPEAQPFEEAAYAEATPPHTVAFEQRDFNLRGAAIFGAGLALFLVLTVGALYAFQIFATGQLPTFAPPASNLAEPPNAVLPPEPRLEAVPGLNYQQLQAREREWLNSYGWVDEAGGVTRIPIERAMELVVARGLPARTEAGSFEDSARELPSDSSSGRQPAEVQP